MKKILLIVSLVAFLTLCLMVLNIYIPFNFKDMIYVESYHLRNCVKEWQLQSKPVFYSYTNRIETAYLYKTNIVVGSNIYSSVIRLDSPYFRNRGYLLATENQEIFWVDFNGRIKELK
jgi:hypothetical protein